MSQSAAKKLPDSSEASGRSSLRDRSGHPARSALQWLLILVVLAAATVAVIWSQVGSLHLVPRYLAGERLLLEAKSIDLGPRSAQEVVDTSVVIVNATGSPVDLLGTQLSCRCISTDTFPITVAAGQAKRLAVQTQMPAQPGTIELTMEIFTSHEPGLPLRITINALVE